MSAATAPPPAVDPACQQVLVAGRLCWHAVEICRALDHGVAELQLAIAKAAEHTDALIELALAMTDVEPAASQSTHTAMEGTRP
jgi:hypothetical protein